MRPKQQVMALHPRPSPDHDRIKPLVLCALARAGICTQRLLVASYRDYRITDRRLNDGTARRRHRCSCCRAYARHGDAGDDGDDPHHASAVCPRIPSLGPGTPPACAGGAVSSKMPSPQWASQFDNNWCHCSRDTDQGGPLLTRKRHRAPAMRFAPDRWQQTSAMPLRPRTNRRWWRVGNLRRPSPHGYRRSVLRGFCSAARFRSESPWPRLSKTITRAKAVSRLSKC